MWVTMLIAGGLFVALLAMLWLNVSDAERRREEEARAQAEREAARAEAAVPQCFVCDAPLPPRRTSDEVVIDLERRIAADLAEIGARLASPAPGPGRAGRGTA
jgi:hypothetical protein